MHFQIYERITQIQFCSLQNGNLHTYVTTIRPKTVSFILVLRSNFVSIQANDEFNARSLTFIVMVVVWMQKTNCAQNCLNDEKHQGIVFFLIEGKIIQKQTWNKI